MSRDKELPLLRHFYQDDMRRWAESAAWLSYLGYLRGHLKQRRGKFGKLSNEKLNWPPGKLADYFRKKYPDEYQLWQTKCKVLGRLVTKE